MNRNDFWQRCGDFFWFSILCRAVHLTRCLPAVLERGGVAQLGERLNGIQEVRGSIPLASTGPAKSKQEAVRNAASGSVDVRE